MTFMRDSLEDHLVLHVNPGSIKYCAKIKPWHRKLKFLKRIGLDGLYKIFKSEPGLFFRTSIKAKPFARHEKYIFIKQLWDHDLDYTRTQRYQQFDARLRAGLIISMPVKGYRIANHLELDSYFQNYVHLLQSMSRDGYLPDKGKEDLQVGFDPDCPPGRCNAQGRDYTFRSQVAQYHGQTWFQR